jgi:hypothetical protein
MDGPAKRKRGGRGLGKRPSLKLIAIRVPHEIHKWYYDRGNMSTHMREALLQHARERGFID